MFGWTRPKCPVDARSKVWIERRFAWLCDQFGADQARKCDVVLPTEQYFPKPEGAKEDAWTVFSQICQYMGIEPDDIELVLQDHEGINEDVVLRGERSGVPDIQLVVPYDGDYHALVAAISHELSKHLLFSRGLVGEDDEDVGHLADLFSVYSGLGVISANCVLRESYEDGGTWHVWRMRAQGYLRAHEFGYAIALFAWVRDESSPAWRSYLRRDAKSAMESGLKYLNKTGDALFSSAHPSIPTGVSVAQLLRQLESPFDGARLAALIELQGRPSDSVAIVESVAQVLQDENVIVRVEAVVCLGSMGNSVRMAVPYLLDAMADPRAEVRASAAQAIGLVEEPSDSVIEQLSSLLKDSEHSVVDTAVTALADCGEAAEPALPALVKTFRSALTHGDLDRSELAAFALVCIADSPIDLVQEYLSDDEALYQEAVQTIEDVRHHRADV